MTRGHVNDQTLTLALRYRLQFCSEELVVFAFYEAVPHVLNVLDEICLRFLFNAQLFDAIFNHHDLF